MDSFSTARRAQHNNSSELSPGERVGIGVGVVAFMLATLYVVPGLRRYLAYEFEVNKDKKTILVARGLAMFSFCLQAGDIFNNFYMASDTDFECIKPGCGNDWKDIHGHPTQLMSNFVMFKGTAATLAVVTTQQVLLWLTPNLRGLTMYIVLVFISAVQYLSWYLSYMFGFPDGIDNYTMAYQFSQWIPMAVAIFLIREHYAYNDTLFGGMMADQANGNSRRFSESFPTIPSAELETRQTAVARNSSVPANMQGGVEDVYFALPDD